MIGRADTFGMMKTLLDAHTMGVHASTALLKECGYRVLIAPLEIEDALERVFDEASQQKIVAWIKKYQINRLGISYRLDPGTAVDIVGRVISLLKREGLYETSTAIVKSIHFAGLQPACDYIDKEYAGRVQTFRGGESAEETLIKMGVPLNEIPKRIIEGCKYDKELLKFGKSVIEEAKYKELKPYERVLYPEYGTLQDSLKLRLKYNFKCGFQPLIRAHSGPFHVDCTRKECLEEYNIWCKELADAGYLDILSIGTSQLSQSDFGADWSNKLNGGGVPVNSENEYVDIWKASRPMLVRTYSGTKNILSMAEMYEKTINNAWNALSLWWFNELDGRGPNNLLKNLIEHVETIKYAGRIGKPVETNVPHHFAFRGCDDVTYIVAAFLGAKMAKKCGVRYFILQNMLNTPRGTWGIQDLAKSRAMIQLVKELEDDCYKVILQTRAGLDYFKPDLNEARVQLAAVTAMMDDIDPDNRFSPEIIHVVSYSEALFLATPEVLNESIKITREALNKYRQYKSHELTPDVMTDDINTRTELLVASARSIIDAMEHSVSNLYSPEGLYVAFVAGWLPVPELWIESDEFRYAKCWQTKMSNGGTWLADNDIILSVDSRINKCVSNIPIANYILQEKYGFRIN